VCKEKEGGTEVEKRVGAVGMIWRVTSLVRSGRRTATKPVFFLHCAPPTRHSLYFLCVCVSKARERRRRSFREASSFFPPPPPPSFFQCYLSRFPRSYTHTLIIRLFSRHFSTLCTSVEHRKKRFAELFILATSESRWRNWFATWLKSSFQTVRLLLNWK
jgi:hypothetical protein